MDIIREILQATYDLYIFMMTFNYIISICTRYRDITPQGSRNYIKSVCVKLSKRRYGNYKLIDSWIFLLYDDILHDKWSF
jgi:hypothetical protein